MTNCPILFSGPMVRALLEGRKTQTRRIIKSRSKNRPSLFDGSWSDSYVLDPGNESWRQDDILIKVGDRLWVRETWAPLSALTHNEPGTTALAEGGFYRADDGTVEGEISKWKPSIFMPRHASRLSLTVTDVRVERLQSITEDDAVAEGCFKGKASGRVFNSAAAMHLGGDEWSNARDWYADLWENINGDGTWDKNPWVAAYTFTVERKNIDAPATTTWGGHHEL